MKQTRKKNSLSRAQAAELYKDLQSAVAALKLKKQLTGTSGKEGKEIRSHRSNTPTPGFAISPKSEEREKQALAVEIAGSIKKALASEKPLRRGPYNAVACIMLFAIIKVILSALEASGIASVTSVEASVMSASQEVPPRSGMTVPVAGTSKEEQTVLTALDHRRVELEERAKRLDRREEELNMRDGEYITRLTQLREMTELLKGDRDKQDKRRSNQLEQLANVYGSMDPKEAAPLIEQLDVTIALDLIQRMPEKRIGQILALMSSPKALALTKLLSGKPG